MEPIRGYMNEKVERMRYLNLKQHIDALHLAKLIDDAEALHILTRLQKQVDPSIFDENMHKKTKKSCISEKHA